MAISVKMYFSPIIVTGYPTCTMSYGDPSSSAHATPSSLRALSRSPVPYSPEYSSIQNLVRCALQNPRATVSRVERLAARLHQTYRIYLDDGSRMILRCPPNSAVQLLRHERQHIETEAKVLDMLTAQTQVPASRKWKYEHGSNSSLNHPYLLCTELPGVALTTVSTFTAAQRQSIDRWLGYHLRCVAQVTAPRFGSTQRAFCGSGYRTWREAFLSLFESVMRDAEDSLVSIPYDAIRHQLGLHSEVLDDVRTPQLVPMHVTVLVDPYSAAITGLLGFGDVIWGDPMMTEWATNASEQFWEGWGSCPARIGRERVRQLLYALYNALLAVTTRYYRPRDDNAEWEARAALTKALDNLADA